MCERNGKQQFRRNLDEYVLNISSGMWQRLTHRKWQQFQVRQEDSKLFVGERHPDNEAVLPEGAALLAKSTLLPKFTRADVGGVSLAFYIGVGAIEIIVEDNRPDIARQIADQIRSRTEAAIYKRCTLWKAMDDAES